MTHHFRHQSLQAARKPLSAAGSAAGYPGDWPMMTLSCYQTSRCALRVVHDVKVVVVADEDESNSP